MHRRKYEVRQGHKGTPQAYFQLQPYQGVDLNIVEKMLALFGSIKNDSTNTTFFNHF